MPENQGLSTEEIERRCRETRHLKVGRGIPKVCVKFHELREWSKMPKERRSWLRFHVDQQVCGFCKILTERLWKLTPDEYEVRSVGFFAKIWAQLRKFFYIGPSA